MEDHADAFVMTLANTLLLLYAHGLGDSNMLWQVLFHGCRAANFWETDQGRAYGLESASRATVEHRMKIPTWAIDRHTPLFHQRLKDGHLELTDERFGGTFGRRYLLRMYKWYGRLMPFRTPAWSSRYGQNYRWSEVTRNGLGPVRFSVTTTVSFKSKELDHYRAGGYATCPDV